MNCDPALNAVCSVVFEQLNDKWALNLTNLKYNPN
jgi:hypothetical protein